jgi:predicted metal-dependent enzyme (double-stranded beta helix superfamily)
VLSSVRPLYVHPEFDLGNALPIPAAGQVTISGLAQITRRLSRSGIAWDSLVRHDPDARWYTRLLRTDAVEIWLLGWWPGQGTAVHDHGGALGALTVLDGLLAEDVYDVDWQPEGRRHHVAGTTAAFMPEHVHAVTATGHTPTTSIHAYSPPALPLRYTPSGDMVGTGVLQ